MINLRLLASVICGVLGGTVIGGIVYRDSNPVRDLPDCEPPNDDGMRNYIEKEMRMRAEIKAKLKAEGLEPD